MKYLIPKHTKCIVSIFGGPAHALHGKKHIVDKENFFTDFPVILDDTTTLLLGRILPGGWQWIIRVDGGICMFNMDIFVDFDKQDIVPL